MQATLEERFAVPGAFLVGLLFIATLIFWISVPPAQDYPNHLARYWLIAGGASVPPTSSMFAIDWRYASTNIGADLIVALLTGVGVQEALGAGADEEVVRRRARREPAERDRASHMS